jgi:four helix bundle protein
MGEQSSNKNIEIFTSSKKLVIACYALTSTLPPDEKTNLTFFLRNAALRAHLSISQGAFLKKKKARKTFLQEAKQAFIVIDAAVDILVEVGFVTEEQTNEVVQLSSLCYQQLNELLHENADG